MGIVWWFCVAQRYSNRLATAKQDIQQYEQEYALLQAASNKKDVSLQKNNDLQKQYQQLKTLYQQPLVDLISRILLIGQQLGCTIESIKAEGEKKKEWYLSKMCALQFTTHNYENLVTFLQYLEQWHLLPHSCSITSTKGLLTCKYVGKLRIIIDEEEK